MITESITMTTEHQAVMLQEAIAGLNIKPSGIYVDATYGRGGHARAILAKLNAHGKLLVMDKDPAAISDARQLAAADARVSIFAGSFKNIGELCQQMGVVGKIDGVLFDLGVSSPQLDQAERGFSFMRDGKLDMRMDHSSGISAAEWLAVASAEEIAAVLKNLGEERFSNRIARAITSKRIQQPITTTKELADIICAAIPVKEKHKHPATRSFQAIRIYINQELEDLSAALKQVTEVLNAHGRLVAISFHSLEDRIVKQYIAQQAKGDDFPHLLPIKHSELHPKLRKIGKAIKPSVEELAYNVRARSATLRIAEKLSGE